MDYDIDGSLTEERIQFVLEHLIELGSKSVLDLGCGKGALLERLVQLPQLEKIVGIDISSEVLNLARQNQTYQNDLKSGRLSIRLQSFTEEDEELKGFDTAILLETIEHIDPNKLSLVERAVFSSMRPNQVIITTPNQEYNKVHDMPNGVFRHPDHRFEWNRQKFEKWSNALALRQGYTTTFFPIGEPDFRYGSPTQMALFQLKP